MFAASGFVIGDSERSKNKQRVDMLASNLAHEVENSELYKKDQTFRTLFWSLKKDIYKLP